MPSGHKTVHLAACRRTAAAPGLRATAPPVLLAARPLQRTAPTQPSSPGVRALTTPAVAAPLLCLQRLDGMPAKRTTKDEWVDVMTNILNARKARVEDKKSAYKAAKKPLLTIDNAAWYKIKYEDLGFDMEKLPLPARSPDIHKFVEHAVANLENTMTEWERDHPNGPTPRSSGHSWRGCSTQRLASLWLLTSGACATPWRPSSRPRATGLLPSTGAPPSNLNQ